jgi:hypothetical protein
MVQMRTLHLGIVHFSNIINHNHGAIIIRNDMIILTVPEKNIMTSDDIPSEDCNCINCRVARIEVLLDDLIETVRGRND